MSLFRSEVLAERSQSQWGSVIVTQAPGLRWASIGLVLASCAGLAFVLSLDYARKVRVAGYLEPKGGIAEVAAPVAGRIAARFAEEGERVRAGQPLLALDLGRLDPQGRPLHALEAEHLAASAARLEKTAAAQAAKQRVEAQSAQRELEHLAAERQALLTEQQATEQSLILLARSEARLLQLLDERLAAPAEYERERQQVLAAEQSASQIRRALAENARQADLRREALAALERERRLQELRIEQQRADLKRQLQRVEDEQTATIVAPQGGLVAFVQFQIGDRVTPEQVLMTVTPESESAELILLAEAGAAGDIALGDEVRFKALGGARRSRKPVGAAVVRELSTAPQKPYKLISWIPVNGPVFRARATVREYPGGLNLRNGVQVDAFVVTRSRKLWRWLIDPFLNALDSL